MAGDFVQIDEIIAAVARTQLQELVKPSANAGVTAQLPDLLRIVDGHMKPGAMRECLHAGLYVLADNLDEAHTICQEIPNKYGSAWHAVVHRREGDFWNSKYWWRRTAGLWRGLAAEMGAVVKKGPADVAAWGAGGGYDPAGFVDLVETYWERNEKEILAVLVEVQRCEWLVLFEECWRAESGLGAI